jgi:hypothetical protein
MAPLLADRPVDDSSISTIDRDSASDDNCLRVPNFRSVDVKASSILLSESAEGGLGYPG